jgi:hypothetical protein
MQHFLQHSCHSQKQAGVSQLLSFTGKQIFMTKKPPCDTMVPHAKATVAVSKPEGTVVHPPLDQLVACPVCDLLTAALFPLVLLGCCFFLSLGLFLGSTWPKTAPLMRLYQHLEEWAMLEIFLLAILVTIIKMSGNTEIVYNSGVFCFVGLVLTTVTMNSVVDRDKFWRTIEAPGAQPEWLDWSPDIVLLELEKSRHLVPAEQSVVS